ncbi:AI-2E family transporter YdiK [Enterobacter quasiroggenkampii]|uniref:AI-2E family transporter YdiK n=1 Tax=Enterobacter quasiroggenkampii TaxID=2497436 RepID=UPI0021D22563|nr:AI-2E family transporter YdiK [Enterobacter quasiroggenkampii]MCU6306359.1 AI-2E family transporter YdiK [Enterobacter quasiroggenkampii]MCU6398439.1 AI-2E family transporter YdiK [Enterobacter quasiroggenkampii]
MNTVKSGRDLPQTLFSIILFLALLCCALWLLQPFLLSVVWAGLIVIATWPLFMMMKHKLHGRKSAAIAIMILFLSTLFLVPIIFSAGMLSLAIENTLTWLMHIDKSHLPELRFLVNIPLIGGRLHDQWLTLITQHADNFFITFKPWLMHIAQIMLKELSQFGALIINGVLMLIACLMFYQHGESISRGLRKFAWRIAHERGDLAITLAGKTVQAVAMGVVLTAVIQAAVAGLGLLVCGLPSAALLTGIIFMLCLMQLGPIIIMLPAACWLFYNGFHWSGALLLIWSFIAGSLDNILKPVLIKRGANTSILLIMAGVIGGMLTWGMIGLMVGPVLLAVSWTLLSTWVSEAEYQPTAVTKELL